MILLGFLMSLFGVWLAAEPSIAASLRMESLSPFPRRRFLIGIVLFSIGVVLLFGAPAPARAAALGSSPTVRIPDAAALYRRVIEQVAADVWGAGASPARLAGQMHAESNFDRDARAFDGGEGLAQFMPATTKWIAEQFPEQLGEFDPWDPRQAVLAAAIYDQYLRERAIGATPCDTWAFALAAYNGGLGWLNRDRKRALANGADPTRWFNQVERFSSRSASARVINRAYVRRILQLLEPAYIDAGWTGEAVCS